MSHGGDKYNNKCQIVCCHMICI